MIRPFTCLCMLLAGGSGLYLYQEKHRTAELDTQVEHVIKDIRDVKEKTALLKADWAVLNTPDRLGELAQRFLALKQTEPDQFVRYADLAAHLPPVAMPPAAPDAGTDGDTPDATPLPSLPAVADAGPIVTAASNLRTADAGAGVSARADAVPPPRLEATPPPRLEATPPPRGEATPPEPLAAAPARAADATPTQAKPHAVASADHAAGDMVRHARQAARETPTLAKADPTPSPQDAQAARARTHVQAPPAHSLLARTQRTLVPAPMVAASAVALSRPAPVFVGSALGTGRASLPPPVPISASYQPQ